ncbi:RNase P subunit p30 family protein [[Eubacterium] cellulosolvens]
MRRYADLHLHHSLFTRDLPKKIELIKKYGVDYVGVTLQRVDSSSLTRECNQALKQSGLDPVSRVDLYPKNKNELLSLLRRFRQRFEIIAVKCLNNDVSLTAARDRRVDIIFFNLDNPRFRFNTAIAHLCNCSLEVNIKNIAHQTSHSVLGRVSGEIQTALDHKIPLIISSGASDIFEIKPPQQMASLGQIFGADKDSSLKMVSDNPITVIERNRKKHEGSHIFEGVEIIRRSKQSKGSIGDTF